MPRIDKHHLDQAAEARIISPTQAEDLWAYLCAHAAAPAGPRFDLTHVLYYLGGMLAIGAMSVFMNLGWESFGGWGIVSIALLYFGIAWQFAGRFERAAPALWCVAAAVLGSRDAAEDIVQEAALQAMAKLATF